MNTLVFLHDGYADWELAYILPELVERKRPVVTFGLTGRPVTSLGGLRVTPDSTIDRLDVGKAEALILPGGSFWKSFSNPELDRLVREARAGDWILGAICDATGYLAQLGLLDGVEHSSNSLEFLRERAPAYRGGELYRDEPATRSGKLVTADGFGAVDFTGKLVELFGFYSPEVLAKLLRANKEGKWRD